MSRFFKGMVITSIVLTLSASALIVRGYGGGYGPVEGEAITLPSMIRTAEPKKMDFTEALRWFGTAKSRSKVPVYTMTAGRIISLKVSDGSSVRRGDVLFTIGGPRTLGEMKTLKEKIRLTKKRITLAKKDVRIKVEAVRRKMIKGGELRAAEDALMKLNLELVGLQQEMTSLRGGLTVAAPVEGVFTNRLVNKGQYVEKGVRLADVISPNSIRIRASIYPPAKVRLKGLKAIINGPGVKTIIGTVKKIMPELTKGGATIIWIEGADIDAFLRPGEALSGVIELTEHRGVLSIPGNAVVRDDSERPFVFIKKDGQYVKTAIKTGLVSGANVEVLLGIDEGDKVVISGAYELFYRDFSRDFKVAD